jgi:hypothetical protein
MTDVVAVQGAAEIVGLTEAQVRHAVANGKMIPEATVAGHALWRVKTLERWARSERRTFPISPPLEVVGLGQLADRFGVSVALIRKWRRDGTLPEPDHAPSPRGEVQAGSILLWDEKTIRAITPTCGVCGKTADPKTAVRSPGLPTVLVCECGESVPARPVR